MLFQVITENGVKKIKPLTADTGTGAPVGSYLMLEKKSNPQGYLYCDGSTFDSTAYPALYQYLGSNVLPDFREFSPVGAEQNTTNVYDASTNPNGTIHDHDVYTEGESKDDQVQEHFHEQTIRDAQPLVAYSSQGTVNGYRSSGESYLGYQLSTRENTGRHDTVTRGKRKAVFVYIKATSGLTENQQENVLNTINDNLSYSTTEHKTGKKWIDGKPIYSKTIDFGALPNAMLKTVNFTANNIDKITKIDAVANSSNYSLPLPYASIDNTEIVRLYVNKSGEVAITTSGDLTPYSATVTIEYTKTT
jgi:hypothetical protein